MANPIQHQTIKVGLVGLGFMGSSIIASLLALRIPVRAIAPFKEEQEAGLLRIKEQLILCEKFNLLKAPVESYLELLTVSSDYAALSDCDLVVECVIEDIDIKETVFKKISSNTKIETILASNTSAIPISQLQKLVPHPERFIGIHWAEPACGTRFLEIICGEDTNERTVNTVKGWALNWGKEPTVLRKDIRGFITNRLMYAVYREILHLVENGTTNIEDADKCFRYDAGSWMTLMGIFRRMDFEGLKDHLTTLKRIFPQLSNSDEVPEQMLQLVNENAKGIQNGKGFFTYTEKESKLWAEAFSEFNGDIFHLAAKYPERLFIENDTENIK
ncbi:MAG: 3-hydroxyacyl-CoA dehydrogenase family protein [Chitinophagaceae bacterium]|nr:3-hydroxyacyl-CoA dehydrogenase family protein [Chitinophagaceae bacterium]